MIEALIADGVDAYLEGFRKGIAPDPAMWVDEWSDEYMRIPRGNGAEPGKYSTDRTPFARKVMRCLSPDHPAKRVVAMVASQLLKTQVGINWLSASIHQAPGNMLVLLPTGNLAKRVSGRIAKTIEEVPVLRERVASPRSRDSRNTIDTKEFSGGTMHITTAGSASNLAEISARYIYGDEVDRWEASVDKEGDPVELAEARTSTFGRNAKIYYTSSPTIEGASRIHDLFEDGTQEYYYVPCPHCGHSQTLEFEHLIAEPDFSAARYACCECGTLIDESYKTQMLAAADWVPSAVGDGETVSFMLSALYAPLGWVSWADLCKQHAKARAALEKGDPEPMQVFYNTRLAKCWDNVQERIKAQDLKDRAEDYPLRSVPDGVLILTAAVDVQGDRLELEIKGWGEGMERWTLDYQAIHGDPASSETWLALDEILRTPLRNRHGNNLTIQAVAIDSGGHHTQEVYEFTRLRKYRKVFAVKGASKPGRPVIPSQPSKVDINHRGRYEKHGTELWMVGTDTAKDWLTNRRKLPAGPGAQHYSKDLPSDYYDQLVSENKVTRYVKGFKRTEWTKKKADRNEALDLDVYNLAAAHRLGLHKWRENDWARERLKVDPPQADLFVQKVLPEPQPDQEENPAQPEDATNKTTPPPGGVVVSAPKKPVLQTRLAPMRSGGNDTPY